MLSGFRHLRDRDGLTTRLGRRALYGLGLMVLITAAGVPAQTPLEPAPGPALPHAVPPLHPPVGAGQSATQLPDGKWLVAGGDEQPSELLLEDARGTVVTTLPIHLAQPRSGHSATLLPDGSVLIYGGVSPKGQTLDTAERFDRVTMRVESLGKVGLLPRAYHTATVLADGRMLMAGGLNGGASVTGAELFNPRSDEVEYLDAQLDQARIKHLAALLPASSVLLWGGVDSSGRALTQGSLYDPLAQQFSAISAGSAAQLAQQLGDALAPRVVDSRPAANAARIPVDQPLMVHFSKRMAVASLGQDSVTLIGPNGTTAVKVVPVEDGSLLFVTPAQDLQPAASYTLFINGAADEAGRVLPFTAIGFTTEALGGVKAASAPVGKAAPAATTVLPAAPAASSSVTAAPPAKTGAASASSGATRWLSALSGWLPQSLTSLLILAQQAADTHADLVSSIEASDEDWIPGPPNYHGNWRSGRGHWGQYHPPVNDQLNRALNGNPEIANAMQRLTPGAVSRGLLNKLTPASARTARKGATAVTGQVLRLNSVPLANVSLSIGGKTTRTDGNGEFILSGVPAGHQVLVIDGAGAGDMQHRYGRYEYGMNVTANQVNALPFVIWMTRLDTGDAMDIASPTTGTTVLTNPKIPGLQLNIPAGTVIRDAQGKIVTQISMTAIPTDQPPFPLPNVPVPTYFTIQPGGAHLEGANGSVTKGAQLIYPNFTHSAPGTRITFWNYDALQKGWYVYGQGTVSKDGVQIVPDPGVVIYEFSGAMVGVPGNAPSNGPNEGGSPQCGDPVDCSTGLFINAETDLSVPDIIPGAISRTYRPQDNASRAFGIGTNLSYDMFIIGDTNPYTYQNLILPNGGSISFPRISSGTGWTDAVYQNTTTPGMFFGAVIKWDQSTGYAWTLTLKDGTVYSFADEAGSTSARACAVRAISDRNGNSLTLTRDGNANLTKIVTPNGRNLNLLYDTSNRITQASDDLGRTVIYTYDTQGRLATVTDPAGNVEKYTYDSLNDMLTVVDKRGNTKVTNIYDANGRVSQQTYSDGSVMQFAYTLNSSGAVAQTNITDTRGFVHQSVFNSSGYVTSITRAIGQPEQQQTEYGIDPNTNLITSVTDALNRTTTYVHDALGNVTNTTFLAGTSNAVNMSVQYDPTYSQPIQSTDPNGNSVAMSYDPNGNLLLLTDALGHAISYSYDPEGRVSSRTDANNNTITLTYFGADLASATDALGRRISFSGDTVGRLVGSTDPLGAQTSFVYDALDQIRSITDPDSNIIQFTYDPDGNETREGLNKPHNSGQVQGSNAG